MKNLQNYTDLYAIGIGIAGALTKGLKKKLGTRATILGMFIGAVFAYGTIGIIDQFFSNLNEKIVITISFAVGWAANEVTEYIDDAIKVLGDKYLKKVTKKIDNEDPI